MKKLLSSIFMLTVLLTSNAKGQVLIDTISLVTTEETNAEFTFNNTKLMAGNNIFDRYLVYCNSDTVFLNVYQFGIWTKKIVYTGSNIKSATLAFYKDTIWVCWKDGAYIKASYSADSGTVWNSIPYVSPAGSVVAPSVYASSNGKIHFVWSNSSDTTVYHRVYSNGVFSSPYALSNINTRAEFASVIAIGDTVLCTWKEFPLPSQVWFARSVNGGVSWDTLLCPPKQAVPTWSFSKDANLAYAYDSVTNTHYVYLAFDYQNEIYLQRSTDFGNTWSIPETISTSNQTKYSQFAHLECNNNGFVGISHEQRPTGTSIFNDTKKDVGFTYSTNWGNSGSFSIDTLAYAHNGFGSAYPAFNKIDENNFYLAWLTKDTVNNKMKVFERLIHFSSPTGISKYEQTTNPKIHIFPNPFSAQTTLQTDNPLHNATLTVYNCFGQTIAQINNLSGKTIIFNRDNLSSELYFVRLTEDSKVIMTGKLVITD